MSRGASTKPQATVDVLMQALHDLNLANAYGQPFLNTDIEDLCDLMELAWALGARVRSEIASREGICRCCGRREYFDE